MRLLLRLTGLGYIYCRLRKRHQDYPAYFGHCSFDSVDGLSDITYTTEYFCKFCGRKK